MDTNILFVYGTLMKTFKNEMSNFLQQNATFKGTGYFQGKLYNISSYPGAISSNKKQDLVFGEIYTINHFEKLIPILDTYEGISPLEEGPHEYVRKKVAIKQKNDDKTISAWTYLYNWNVEESEYILSGNYLTYYQQKLS